MIEWIKKNKQLILLFVVALVGFYIFRSVTGINISPLRLSNSSLGKAESGMVSSALPSTYSYSQGSERMGVADMYYAPESPALSTSADRKVITDSSVSLLVIDVREVGQKIVDRVQQVGGFMVQTSYNRPTESPFGTIIVRVPSKELKATLEYFKSVSIKVTSEDIMGTDVTDQYEDIEEKLSILQTTKAKFEAILAQATNVADTLMVQREVLSIQSQIDALKGRKDSIAKNAEYSKITVFLSTDELALPYTPDVSFRPGVIFKLAVRSLVGTLRGVGEWAIWIGVYAAIWLPILIVIMIIRRILKKRALN